jgi:hypothetical protein
MATVASAMSPAIEHNAQVAAAPAMQADWGSVAGSASDVLRAVRATQSSPPDSVALAILPKRPAALTWLLAVVTLGIYPLISWLKRGKKAKPDLGL